MPIQLRLRSLQTAAPRGAWTPAVLAIMLSLASAELAAQFNLPVPAVVDARLVIQEDLQKLFVRAVSGGISGRTAQVQALRSALEQ